MNAQYAAVAQRAQHRCEYCHAPEALFNLPFEVEHIMPPSYGGTEEEANLALACRACNLFKSDRVQSRDPASRSLVRLFHPRDDSWDEHFAVDPETGSVLGTTAIGRATTVQLRMNSAVQLAARIQWMRLDLFP